MRKAIHNEKLRNRLIAIFNEKNENHYYELRKAIKELAGIDKLKHQPQILNTEIGQDTAAYFEKIDIVPSLLFVDPWGYKGLSLRLVNSVLKDWGCDCIFFFNYNRINMDLCKTIKISELKAAI